MNHEQTHNYEFFVTREFLRDEVNHLEERRVVIVMPADLSLKSWGLLVVCHYISYTKSSDPSKSANNQTKSLSLNIQ